MNASNGAAKNVVDGWLQAGQTVRISGLDFMPKSHRVLTDAALCVIKGQATAYFLCQHPKGNIWLLKKFAPSKRPSDEYMHAVHHCLPGGIEFYVKLVAALEQFLRRQGLVNI